MKKKIIRLTESELRNIVKKSVNKIISESSNGGDIVSFKNALADIAKKRNLSLISSTKQGNYAVFKLQQNNPAVSLTINGRRNRYRDNAVLYNAYSEANEILDALYYKYGFNVDTIEPMNDEYCNVSGRGDLDGSITITYEFTDGI